MSTDTDPPERQDFFGRVVATLTHELKTPLHSILTLAQLVLSEADGPLTDEQRKQVTLIQRNGDQLLELITDLLRYSALASRGQSVSVEEFSPAVVLASLCDSITPIAQRSEVKLVVQTEKVREKFVSDRTLFRQILHNLVSNAVKFSVPSSEVSLYAETLDDDALLLEVADSGIGISPELQEKVFEEFYQVENADNRRFGGVGLGLALVREAVRVLQGEIDLKSEPGQGTLFRVKLPSLRKKLRIPRIGLVDSDPVLRTTLKSWFESQGFECILLDREAVVAKELDEHRLALLLLSIERAHDADFSVLESVRKRNQDLPVILMSTFDGPSERSQGFLLGANDYIVKPFDLGELSARIRRSI